TQEPDACVSIMEGFFVHRKGEKPDGTPLLGEPFTLEPWEIFIVYNLLGFWYKGTNERRYKEAFIMLGRKNGKTSFIAALSFAVSIIQRRSGSTVYVVAAALKQAMESFQFLLFSLKYKGIIDDFDVKDNSFEHSIKYTFTKDGIPDGTIEIQIMASNPEAQDSFNCNFAIADEVAAYKSPAQYNRFKEAMKSYTNKLMVGITTAGDSVNSFGYQQMEYAVKVAKGLVKDDIFFSFVARADQDEKGNCDYTDPVQHEKANPNYGVTIKPDDMRREALQAQNNPQQRKDFLSRSLNIYTSAMRAWFDIEEFKASDKEYNWTLEELAKLPVDWYGGADLSRMYDLTAAALYGQYKGVDICITHAFFPVTMAARKADEDNIPLFGWADDGYLTMCNSPTVNIADVVNWFKNMRAMGFKIRRIGHDRKFAGEEYFPAMKAVGFPIVDQPQFFYVKSQGFRHIEKAVKDGRFYYMHSEAYEYCVSNVRAVEKTDDAVQYEKIQPQHRIDLFDASVFACVQMITANAREKKAKAWFGEGGNE
ncbi:MAG: terminase large subunit, partial [Exiguobacterium sp.]|nr:terminase large subunit [Exiguobacterium sp.]